MRVRKALGMLLLVVVAALSFGTIDADPAGAALGVPWGDARHFSRSTSGQTPVQVKIAPNGVFYEGLIQNSVADWTQSSAHAIVYTGQSSNPAPGFPHLCDTQALYHNCITVAHDSGQPCGGGTLYHNLEPSFNHVHIDQALIAVNLSSACTDLWHMQNTICRLVGKALGVTGQAGTAAPCDGVLHPWPGDIDVLTYIGSHYHAGSIHLPVGV